MKKQNMSVIVSFIIVVGFIGLVIFILMSKTEKVDPLEGINKGVITGETAGDTSTNPDPNINPNTNTGTTNPKQNKMDTNARKLKDFNPVASVTKLEKIDLIVGSGAEVKAGNTVSVHYTGAVAATGAIFQSSKDFGTEPVTFPLANVIKGWTNGIPGMKIGGTRRLVIPADMAYGANPPGGSGIPANAALVFDVELIAIK